MLWDHEMLSCFQLEHCTKFRKGTKSGMHLYALILPVWGIQSPLSQLILLNDVEPTSHGGVEYDTSSCGIQDPYEGDSWLERRYTNCMGDFFDMYIDMYI